MFTYALDRPRRPIAQALHSTVIHASLIVGAVYATNRPAALGPKPHETIYIPQVARPEMRHVDPFPRVLPRVPESGLVQIPELPRVDLPIPVPTRATLPGAQTMIVDHFCASCPATTAEPFDSAAAILSESEVDDSPVLMVPGTLRYPAVLQAAGIEGKVTLSFVIDTLGHVEPEGITIEGASNQGFEAAARDAVLTSGFRPGRKQHHPVRVRVRQTVTFSR